MQRINNPADINEEISAAGRISEVLSGLPIIETSGDEHHQITPLSIWFKVKLSENGGDIVYVNILQPDRHHPSLVFPTITNALSSMPEFKDAKLKPIHPDTAYNHDTGVVSIAYELPKGGADHLIHDLAESFENKAQPINAASWTSKITSANISPPPMADAGGWLQQIMNLFKPADANSLGR